MRPLSQGERPRQLEAELDRSDSKKWDLSKLPKECKQGHPYTPQTLLVYTRKDGIQERRCKICRRKKKET